MKKYHPAAGTHLFELDTPVLFLDIEAVEKNYKGIIELASIFKELKVI